MLRQQLHKKHTPLYRYAYIGVAGLAITPLIRHDTVETPPKTDAYVAVLTGV
jgi:hypothetical protein